MNGDICMTSKTAIVTGITGQDGSYLAEFLLSKGYNVHGTYRRASTPTFDRIEHLLDDIQVHQTDLTDQSSLYNLVKQVRPSEVYNLAAQSFVGTSWDQVIATGDITGLGTARILEAIRSVDESIRFYQASSSEMFGAVHETPQRETTVLHPRSPYGVAKVYSHYLTINYRESYDMHACSGILFNHESPRRGLEFVTRKITRGLANIAQGLEQCLYLGNMDALRDWGHAKDYVRMQWMMLQQDQPDDFVIATGKQISVREFVRMSAEEAGIELEFTGEGVNEIATIKSIKGDNAPGVEVGDVIVKVDPRYFRPAEVETLLGDPAKAKKLLGWTPEITVEEMCAEMVACDLDAAKQNAILKTHGYSIPVSKE